LLGAALAVVAVSMAPLPGSPVDTLPSGSGAASNLAAALLLMAAAIALGTAPEWPWSRALLGVVVVPVLGVAASTSTLAFPTVAAVPGAAISAARLLAGAALLTAAPLLAGAGPARPSPLRAVIVSALAVLALSLFVPSALRGAPAWVAVAVFAGAVAHGAAACRLAPWLGRQRRLIAVATVFQAVAATALAVIAGS
jgi:hypothetical protein